MPGGPHQELRVPPEPCTDRWNWPSPSLVENPACPRSDKSNGYPGEFGADKWRASRSLHVLEAARLAEDIRVAVGEA